ncbi:major facilitator superfamily domain-containing protein [Suillus placidus]|uniref:Major facilitator superfamily domain-containing protein n=1 Tax=Suillus placidus TaxID=48579 RepID=A0A9P6ZS79_9AGAM|nr:major facilitator superfamily domain-containing protein [Suillus placidus]
MNPLQAPSGRSSSEEAEKHAHGISVATKDVDTGAALVAGMSGDLDPDDVARVRLGTVFYLSYLLFEYPQNLALQRFPVASISLFGALRWPATAACTNFAGLFVARFILGICEGSITAGFMIVSSMFYTRSEQTSRVGYWFLMNGTGSRGFIMSLLWMNLNHAVLSADYLWFYQFWFTAYQNPGFAPWQWLMIITGILTLITAVVYWFFFPDSPTNAWFLTPAERVIAIRRLKENQTGVENKHFKKDQGFEGPKDMDLCSLCRARSDTELAQQSTANHRDIIGFSALQTTLLSCVDGFMEVATIWTGVMIVSRIPNSRAYVGAVYFIPALVGVLMIEFLPWSNQIALLFAIWLVDIGITGFVLSLAWLTSVTAGHTKRVTTNAIMLSAYCVGNGLGPFMWQTQYKPRNHIPWIVIGLCYLVCPLLLLTIRFMLSRENKKRDAEPVNDKFEEVYIEQVTADGKRIEVKVDKEFLDLTDIQNRDFRYVL